MNTELATIFTDQTSEFNCLQALPPCVDLTDWPLPSTLPPILITNPNFYVTSPISATGYFEIEYMLANNFWGVNMNFGNSVAGIQIRQGISHLVDKVSFTNNQADIAASASAIDNPLPLNNGGLPTPNPCNWDLNFTQSGSNCHVGAPGGTSYHLAASTGVNFPWQPALGSPDFCAAATHFISAGLATGKDPTTCVLTGISSGVTAHTVNIFVRSDDPPRLDLGNSLAQEICALFGQGFATGCAPYLTVTPGPITAFPGFTTSNSSVNLSWHIYTAGFGQVFPFDSSLFFLYNSQFVSGISGIQQSKGGFCSNASVGSFSAANYMYMCSRGYDSISSQMEFSPCLSAPGDPVSGATSNLPTPPGNGLCLGTSKLSAISAGVQAEDVFGRGAYTLPVYALSEQFGYLSNWSRVINDQGNGIPNYFTWLDAYSPNPAQPGTIRQGFKQTTRSLNPYIISTVWDVYIAGNIYDSLNTANPLSKGQLLEWMSVSSQQLSNFQLTYTPPSGTVSTFRFTLRGDLFWQDGRKVTSWDVKFSYLSLQATGAFQSTGLAPMTGVTVITSTQFDVNVNAVGPFTKLFLTSPTVIPGHYWSTCAGSIWDTDVSIGRVPDSCMSPDPSKIIATFDPLANHILIGSGPWECLSSAAVVGTGCSPTGSQNPLTGGYTLTRFGMGTTPGAGISDHFFRSSGNLALWIWSQDNGDFTHDFINFTVVAACFGIATGSCSHFAQGIGGTGGTGITVVQVSIVNRFVGVNWVAGNGNFVWTTSPPTGIVALPPVLYEGSATLNPASRVGCASPYPTGGYDC